MAHQYIRTHAELTAALRSFAAEHEKDIGNDDIACWFVALRNAALILDSYRKKDIAEMLLEGTVQINAAYVDEWCNQHYEDIDYFLEQGDEVGDDMWPEWDHWIAGHFGVSLDKSEEEVEQD